MIDFPNTPSDGQIFTVGDTSWQYSSSVGAWLTYPYDLTLSNDLQVGNNLQVDGNGRVDGYLNAGTFFSSNDATPTFATASNYMYAGGGKFSLGEKLVFDSATPGSGGFGMLTVVGRIRGALENYEIVSLDKGTKTINNGQIASGVATITTSTSHAFTMGDTVVIENISSPFTALNGAHRVTGTGTLTFTFDTSEANQASQAATGTAKVRELTLGLHPEITSPDGGIVSPAGLGMRLDEYNYWFLNSQFRVGSASQYFRWNGSILEVAGKITSTTGAIGGWDLASSTLTSATNAVTLDSSGVVSVGTAPDIAVLSSADATHRLWIGNAASSGAAFKVTKAGVVTASGADIQGALNASSLTINGNITATTANITGGFLQAGNAKFGLTVSGGNHGVWIGTHNYWYDTGSFKVGGAAQSVVWDTSSLTVTGVINATSGNLTGALTVASGTMKFGQAADGGSKNGLYVGTNDYWYSTGEFKVGGANGIVYGGSGNITIGTGVTISGALSAATGSFSGTITSTAGNIAGWVISPTAIHNSGGTTGMGSVATPFWAGAATPSAPFQVTSTGALRATNANITGILNATSGNFTGYVTAGTTGMRFGSNVNASNSGIYLDTNNYWYNTGAFNVGGAAGILYSGSGQVAIGTGVTVSGPISGSTIDIGGADTSSFHVDANGNIWLGAAAYDINTNPFAVANDGSLRARQGFVGGWAIATASLTSNTGNITLSNDGNITAGTSNNVVRISGSDATYRLWAGNSVAASAPFSVTQAGALTATSGSIAGWTLSPSAIHNSAGTTGMGSGATPFWAGGATPNSVFHVTSNGAMRATNVNISGVINASSGTIGGFTIASDSITSGSGVTRVGLTTTSDFGIYAGDSDPTLAPFSVDRDGTVRIFESAAERGTRGIIIGPGANDMIEMVTAGEAIISNAFGTLKLTAGGTVTLRAGASGLSNISLNGEVTGTGSVTATTKFLANGSTDSQTAPGYTWTGDTDTGLFRSSADNLGITTGGTRRVLVNSSGVSVTGGIDSTGSVTAATKFLTNGSTDSKTAPGFTWTGDTNTGFFRHAADTIGVAAGGVNSMRITDQGVGIGTDTGPGSSNWKLNVVGGYTGYPAARIYADRASSTEEIFTCTSDYTSTALDKFRILGTGNAQNRNNSYGAWSDERLKTHIETARSYLADLRAMRVVKFQWKADESPEPERLLGLIAQEVQEISPGLVEEDKDGMLGVKYSVLVPMLLTAIQELSFKVDELQDKLKK